MCVTEEQFYHSSDSSKIYQDLKKRFWWPGLKRDIANFMVKCMICQQVKIEHQIPRGMLKTLDITECKLESVYMDFIMGLPRTLGGHNSIWVIVDRLTKSTHFLHVKITYKVIHLARLFIA